MKRKNSIYSIGIALTMVVLCSCAAIGQSITTQKMYTIMAEEKTPIQIKVSFNAKGDVEVIERCYGENECKPLELMSLSTDFLYSCVPVAGKRVDGTEVKLPNASGELVIYDCEPVTDTEPGELTIYKAGDNTSCPIKIHNRWVDPCK